MLVASAESIGLIDTINRLRDAGMYMIADDIETLAKAAEEHQHKRSRKGASAAK